MGARRWWAFALALLLIALAASPARAQQELALAVSAGYDGYYRENSAWIPLEVRAANQGAPIEGVLRVTMAGGGLDEVIYEAPLALPTQSAKRITFYAYSDSLTNRIAVELVVGGQAVAVATDNLIQIGADTLLYGVVADEPGTLGLLSDVPGSRADAAVAWLAPTSLPEVGAAWNPLDVVVFAGGDSARLSPEQLAALEAWVSTGGQLVVTGGPDWQQTTTGLAHLLPVEVEGTRSVQALPALAARSPISLAGDPPYVVAASRLRQGELLLHEEDLPLLARRAWGAGAVYFLALDPDLAPLLNWTGNSDLWRLIAERVPRLPLWALGPGDPRAATEAVASLPALQLPSPGALLLFLLVYVVVVGPGNYLALRRWGRREWAWVTVPATILLFSLLTYIAGNRLRGSEVVLNQMSVAYGHVDADEMRVNTVLGVYSPRRATYDVVLPGDLLARPLRTFGVGGGDLQAVTRSREVTLRGVRVDVSGVESFIASSYQQAPAVSGQASLRLGSGGATIDVRVQNNSALTLEQVGLFVADSFFPLGDLGPGESATLDSTITLNQATAVAGAAVAVPPVPGVPSAPRPPGSSFSAHYSEILGSRDFFRDPETFPRFQLLESLSSGRRGVGTALLGGEEKITMIAWSQAPQVDLELAQGAAAADLATTVYFLELPLAQVGFEGSGVTVPASLMRWELMRWEVPGQSHSPPLKLDDLVLPPGSLSLEFSPFYAFAEMNVSDLELVLRRAADEEGNPPKVAFWSWDEARWVPFAGAVWGRVTVPDAEPFVGPENAVRVRLLNQENTNVHIREVTPLLTGELP
ncbi:MAG: hypothetical protein R3272_06115 [Candidatus Promineifilaceae bacterium]|nr:hypothetical protein [Candidatus Promineifilaceae bacterium]